MRIICKLVGCKYHSHNPNNLCTREKGYVILNELGQCSIFWRSNGQPRPQPFYPIEAEVPEEHKTEEKIEEAKDEE